MVIDIIDKKRLGKSLSYNELSYIFNGYKEKSIKDYQMSALLMAICINGMKEKEIFDLTKVFLETSGRLDFSDIVDNKVDKHSTGGVGDKTTLIVAPIVASLGIPVIKMSGKGLGITGGTIDKLDSIPGFQTNLSISNIKKQVKEIGIAITSQTSNLVPLDKMIYSLRDVSGTTNSIPLIAVSIMSKKIASGANKLVLDIKYGKGALISTKKEAKQLSDIMIKLGEKYNIETVSILSNMDIPLGKTIGNSLEVKEAIDILSGKEEDNNLTKLCVELATEMVMLGKSISYNSAKLLVKNAIEDKSAYNKFMELVAYQGGNTKKLKTTRKSIFIKSSVKGEIKSINAHTLGKLSLKLGAGRINKDDLINYGVGIKLNKLVGDKVTKGETLCEIFVEDVINLDEVKEIFEIK